MLDAFDQFVGETGHGRQQLGGQRLGDVAERNGQPRHVLFVLIRLLGLLAGDLADQFALFGQVVQIGQHLGAGAPEDGDGRGRLAGTLLDVLECLGDLQHGLGRVLRAQICGAEANGGERLAGTLGFIVGSVQGLVEFDDRFFDLRELVPADLGDALQAG